MPTELESKLVSEINDQMREIRRTMTALRAIAHRADQAGYIYTADDIDRAIDYLDDGLNSLETRSVAPLG